MLVRRGGWCPKSTRKISGVMQIGLMMVMATGLYTFCQDSELCTYKQQILLCNSRAQTKNETKRQKSYSLMLLIQIQPLKQIISFHVNSTL